MGYEILPNIKNYTKFADQSVKILDHGGIVAYVHNILASHVFDVTYSDCFISFRLDFIPEFVFIGAYIQPENSLHFDADMFGALGSHLILLREKNLTPILGGDLNCRFGEMNYAFREQKLSYTVNADSSSNHHGRTYGVDMCNSCGVFPLNHLRLNNITYPGDHTYYKAEKRSQIDFVYTDRIGAKAIIDFTIMNENWHLSDHRPVCLEIKAAESINCSMLLRRAKDLNYEFDPYHVKPVRYLSRYDEDTFKGYLEGNYASIERSVLGELEKENINGAIIKMEENLAKAYRISKKKNFVNNDDKEDIKNMEEANEHFNNLQKCMSGDIIADKDEMLGNYQNSRNKISSDIFKKEKNKWDAVTADGDCKRMWEKIDWKGNIGKQTVHSPIFDDLTSHFEDLYKTSENDLDKIEELKSDVFIPELDDPITSEEMENTVGKMKNGGYDHKINMFKLISKIMSPLLLLLLNIMFYVSYPLELAVSLLIAIPKKGLPIPKNFRGIQMLRALAVLYDRIINNRLEKWIMRRISDVQSGFQKLKSTLHQIFAIRLLIAIAKQNNTTLYIGMFDLEKAFDKVSRYKLLKKLVFKGIGNCMLQALKRIYKATYCVLSYGQEISRKFRTFTGIRQGAASSALLFIVFIDDLVKYLEERCPAEPILDDLHCLLHADDTAILSTSRERFIEKCNHMLDYFGENSLSLNLSKSGYLIINPKEEDHKCSLMLKNGLLDYCSEVKYLGVKISDTGSVKEDIERFLKDKRSNVSIKFRNFCRKNILAPLDIKLKVLNTCVSAALTYACETWGVGQVKSVETAFRQGLKAALSVRDSVNNEIVYAETGEYPLEVRISKQQLKFWLSMKDIAQENPDHYLAKLINAAEATDYVKYYRNLENKYADIKTCNDTLQETFKHKFSTNIREAATADGDSRLGTYFTINPTLSKPEYVNKHEFQRVVITRYRTGSHNLRVEKDRRLPHSLREDRLCTCNTGIQTISHVLLHCPMLNGIREKYGVADMQNGVLCDDFLLEMECILNIK